MLPGNATDAFFFTGESAMLLAPVTWDWSAARPAKDNAQPMKWILPRVMYLIAVSLAVPPVLSASESNTRVLLGAQVGQHWGEDANLLRGSVLHRLDAPTLGLELLPEYSLSRHRLYGGGEVVWAPAARLLLRRDLGTRRLFFELGSGITYYRADSLDRTRWGSRWQFRSNAGLGLRLDLVHELSIVYRANHSSNGGFRAPNPGLDDHGITLEWHFR